MPQKSQSTQGKAEQQTPKPKPAEPKTTPDQQLMPPESLIEQASLNPQSVTADNANQLQRSIGNQAVMGLVARMNPSKQPLPLPQ